jgi:hypothetical protein
VAWNKVHPVFFLLNGKIQMHLNFQPTAHRKDVGGLFGRGNYRLLITGPLPHCLFLQRQKTSNGLGRHRNFFLFFYYFCINNFAYYSQIPPNILICIFCDGSGNSIIITT